MKNIILDLCGGTGSWSKPYKEAGFDVKNITLPEFDVTNTMIYNEKLHFRGIDKLGKAKLIVDPAEVYGILAAPPCTYFSYARTNAKKPRDLEGAMSIVMSCLWIIWRCQQELKSDQQKYPPLKFWVLENPYYGMLRWFLGKPAYEFDPWEFGDAYKKRTALWGYFLLPPKKFTDIREILTEEQIIKHKTNSQELPTLNGKKVPFSAITDTIEGKLNKNMVLQHETICKEVGHSWGMKNKEMQCAYCHVKKSDVVWTGKAWVNKLPHLMDYQRPENMPKFDKMLSKDIHPEQFGKFDRQTRRAITPKGFAEAFYKANSGEWKV
jgi:hypothetical protein